MLGLLTNVPADAIALEETSEEGYGISEDHDANEDQKAATNKGHATKISAQTLEVAQEGIHSKSR